MFRFIKNKTKVDINEKLLDAFYENNSKKIKKCLSKGADINYKYKNFAGGTLLHHSTVLEVVKLLLQLGANVNARDMNGETPLHCALRKDQQNVVSLLIKCGADVNVKNKVFQTPLHIAVCGCHPRIIRELLSNDANPNVVDIYGNTALIYSHNFYQTVSVSETILEFRVKKGQLYKFSHYLASLEQSLLLGRISHAKLYIRWSLLYCDYDYKDILCLNSFNHYRKQQELFEYAEKCFCEVRRLKNDKIGNLTVHEFILKNVVFIYPLDPPFNFDTKKINEKYSIYGKKVLQKAFICLRRSRLMEVLYGYQNSKWNGVIVNVDCLLKISNYLTNEDLTRLVAALSPDCIPYRIIHCVWIKMEELDSTLLKLII